MHSPHITLPLLLLLSSWTCAQYSSYITFLYSDSHTTVTVSYVYTPPFSLRASVTDAISRVSSATPAASVTSAQQSAIESSLSSRLSSSLSTAAAASRSSSAAITSAASTQVAGTASTSQSTAGVGVLATDAARPVSNRHSGLSTGAIIGLSVGLGILGLLLLLGLIFCCFLLRKKNKRKATAAAASQREDEKAGEMSSSDVNVMPSVYPAPAVLPAHYDSREPTLPALSFEKEATSSPFSSPVAEPGHGHQPISNAIPVANAAEAGATVEALASQNKPWAPQGYKPYRASATASPTSEFDFGLGTQGQGSSSWKAQQRHSIARRPVGNS